MPEKRDISVLVLAAGAGTRMKSSLPKVLFPICGRPMVEYVLDAAASLEPDRIVVVVGHKGEEVSAAIQSGWCAERPHIRVDLAWQRQQLGTGHAVMVAKPFLEGFNGDVVILYGDTPLLTSDVLREFVAAHQEHQADLTVMTSYPKDPGYYGRIIRDSNGTVEKIVEARDLTPTQQQVREVNAGLYVVKAGVLLELIALVGNDNAKNEYYLTDIVELAYRRGMTTATYTCQDQSVAEGINDRFALSEAEEAMRMRILKDLMMRGVTVRDPKSTYIDFGVGIGQDTKIEPGTHLRGKTRVGSGCVLGPMSFIIDSQIGNCSTVWFSVVEKSVIGERACVGPFSHLRPQTVLRDGVLVGNYAEIKNSVIREGTKVHHHSYLGDSDVGRDVNIGAGTVTVNYDGVRKYRTVMEDGAFIGCNANLIAPVTVGRGAYIAAGSTINNDVPAGSLAIARERQTIKEGWAAKKKQETQQGR